MITRQKTYFRTQNFFTHGETFSLHENCNGFTVKNTGTNNLTVLNDLFLPGESKAYGCNANEIVVQDLVFVFSAPAVPPAAPANLVTITEKILID